jgi:hypothetical protein
MKQFIKNLLNSSSDTSSKRFTGIAGFFLTLFFCFGYIITLNHQSQIVKGILILKDIPTNILTLLITIIYVSAALIGLGILDKIGGNRP